MRKKIFTFLLALATSVGLMNAAPNDSGSCGANVTYSFNGTTGEMTITGTGPMTDFASASNAPWYSYKNDITSVTITDGVTSVGSYSFGYYGNLVTVTIGNDVETIGYYAFGDCYKFTTLNLGNSVKHIGARAFMWAKVLTGFTLPSTLETIGERAFLQNKVITSLTIPSNVTSIGESAFMYCAALTSIYAEPTTPPTLGATVFDGVPTSIPLYVPNGSVATYTAADQWNAFNIQGYDPAPASTPNSIVINGTPAVGDNSISLTYYFDPANVPGITGYAPTLKVKCVEDGKYDEMWLSLSEISSGTTTITLDELGSFQAGKSYEVCFAYYNGSWVDEMFQSFSFSTPHPHGECGAQGDNLLWDLDPNTGVLTITGSGAMPTIWDTPSSVSWHEYRADITSVSLPEGLTTIGGYAFYSCPGLTSVTIPENVTNIAISAFANCANLASVTLPNSVLSIGQSALALCPSMTSLTLGSGLSSIGTAAFSGCSGLESVTNYATTPQVLDSYAFYNVEISNCELYVPEESVAAYQAATTWKDFKNVQAIGPAPTPEPEPAEDVNITPNADPQDASVYYSTFYDHNFKYALPAGVEAYIATRDGANLLLTKIAEAGQTIPADNAVILKSTVSPFTLTPSDADAVPVNAINSLQGSDDVIATPANCYVLAGTDGVVGFYRYTAANLNAHKAFVIYTPTPGQGNAPKHMPFIFDQATGVESIQPSVISSQKVVENGQVIIIRNGVRYNAAGQIVK